MTSFHCKNYLSRIVGVRQIGERLLFQGGVALNRSVAVLLIWFLAAAIGALALI